MKLFMSEERFEKLLIGNCADGTSVNMGCYSSKVVVSNYFIKALTNRSFLAVNITLLEKHLSWNFCYHDTLSVSHFKNIPAVIPAVIFMRVGHCGLVVETKLVHSVHLSFISFDLFL